MTWEMGCNLGDGGTGTTGSNKWSIIVIEGVYIIVSRQTSIISLETRGRPHIVEQSVADLN